MERPSISDQNELNFRGTELRLGLPGRDDEKPDQNPSTSNLVRTKKRHSPSDNNDALETKKQVVGWPPVRSYRKNVLEARRREEMESSNGGGMYVKVSMDGAAYLRKIDLKVYNSYSQFVKALENMFNLRIGQYSERGGYNGSEYAPTYEDKDGDWMLVGDVPWDMFKSTCKRLRIMKGSDAKGLGSL